jgi:hypothetical protein
MRQARKMVFLGRYKPCAEEFFGWSFMWFVLLVNVIVVKNYLTNVKTIKCLHESTGILYLTPELID